jgi:hypothetical protein
MSATLQQIYNVAFGAPELRQRFVAARLKAAWFVRNESNQTANHANRISWANGLLNDPMRRLDQEYMLFLSNSTIQAAGNAAPDGDIEYVVAVFLDEFATSAAG